MMIIYTVTWSLTSMLSVSRHVLSNKLSLEPGHVAGLFGQEDHFVTGDMKVVSHDAKTVEKKKDAPKRTTRMVLAQIGFLATIEMAAQFALKTGAKTAHALWIIAGLMGYLGVAMCLFFLYSSGKGVTFVQTAWSLMSPILAMISGKLFFNEDITHLILPSAVGMVAQILLVL